jgi:hypothetical protein
VLATVVVGFAREGAGRPSRQKQKQLPPTHWSTMSCSAQHIVHMSLGQAQPRQSSLHTGTSPLVLARTIGNFDVAQYFRDLK